MSIYKFLTFLGVVLMLQLTAGRAQNPREFIDFGSPFENPPDLARATKQLENNLLKESAQVAFLDPSIIAELEQSNEPVIRTYLDENGNNHTATYTKNSDGSITRDQTGSILLNDLNKNGNQVPGVGLVPVDQLLQGSRVVNTTYKDDNVQHHGVYRLNVKTDETIDRKAPSGASEGRTTTTTTTSPRTPSATSTRPTTTATATTNTARQPSITDSIFSNLNRIFDSYWVKSNDQNSFEIFRPTLLSPQEFFNMPSYTLNPANYNFFDFNKELQPQTQDLDDSIKEIRIASDGKTIVSVCYWPMSDNSILTRTPFTMTTIKTKASRQIMTKAAQLLQANKVTIYATGGLTVGLFVSGL